MPRWRADSDPCWLQPGRALELLRRIDFTNSGDVWVSFEAGRLVWNYFLGFS